MKIVKGIQLLKISIIAISQGSKSTFLFIFLVKGAQSNNVWSILNVIENRAAPSVFTCSKSTIETIEQGVK